jgi:hypothetical protein
MERYFILLIIVTLMGITTQRKDKRELGCPDIPASYTKVKTSAGAADDKMYEASSYKDCVQKNIKNSSTQVNKVGGDINPHILYTVLPMGESYYIE